MVIGRVGSSIPFLNFRIIDFDPSTGIFTSDTDIEAAGLLPQDVFVVSFLGYDNTLTPQVLSDAGIKNALNFDITNPSVITPFAGLAIDQDKGAIARVICGTNRGAFAKVIGNDPVNFLLDRDLIIGPDSIWIIEAGNWDPAVESSNVGNGSTTAESEIPVPVDNYLRQSILVMGVTVSDLGIESLEQDAPFRMVYVESVATTAADFQVYREKYSELTINDFALADPASQVTGVSFVGPLIDETDAHWHGAGSIDDVTDPVIFTPNIFGVSRFPGVEFKVNDYIVWNDDSYEIDLITAISDSGDYTLQRNPGGGVDPSQAQFKSLKAAHVYATFFRCSRSVRLNRRIAKRHGPQHRLRRPD